MKRPAGTATISGQRSHSLNASPGLRAFSCCGVSARAISVPGMADRARMAVTITTRIMKCVFRAAFIALSPPIPVIVSIGPAFGLPCGR